MPGPDINALSQLYGLSNTADLGQTLQPATQALQQLVAKQKQNAGDEFALMGMGQSGAKEANLASLDQSLQQQESDMFYKAAAERSQRQYQEQLAADERKRQQDALDTQKKQQQEMGLAGLLGTGLGLATGGLGFIPGLAGGPMAAGLGGQVGGELAQGITGLQFGAQPTYGGLGQLTGYLGQQGAQGQNFQNQNNMLDKYMGGPNGGTPTAPGMGMGGINSLNMGQPGFGARTPTGYTSNYTPNFGNG